MVAPDDSQARPIIVVPVDNDWSSLHRPAEAFAGLAGPRPFLIVSGDGPRGAGPDRAVQFLIGRIVILGAE